jgi:glucosamine kinase
MILIADSGSTKTAWIYTDGTTQETYITGGANPFFRSTADMIAEWNASSLSLLRDKVSHVYFYAAGVVNEEKAQVIEKALLVLFPGAAASVQSDLLAAAHATLGKNSGIACILGTGSNSCLYNGREITAHVPPLGFILGDEGSGAVLGRLLVGDYLKKTMPAELSRLFKDKYPYEYGEILNRVYRQEKPNMFLASLVPFLKKNIDHTYCSTLIKNAFDLFITRNVAQYDGYQEQDICFAGSVAYHFQEQLKWVFNERNLHLGEIVKEPLLNLMEYHLKQPIQ